MVTLPTVEIPGYREALQRERYLRDTAFLGGLELVCGVEVRPLSLRTLLLLEFAGNGYVNPCYFDSGTEALAHALQVLYYCQPEFKAPTSPRYSFWQSWMDGIRDYRFQRHVLKTNQVDTITKEVRTWVLDSLMDAPVGDSAAVGNQSYASHPVLIMDLFAEAGLPHTEEEMMTMPLKKLWQFVRIASRRCYGTKLTNPSDIVAVEGIT